MIAAATAASRVALRAASVARPRCSASASLAARARSFLGEGRALDSVIVARVRSNRLQIIINLPAPKIQQLSHLSFSLNQGSRPMALEVAGIKGSYNLDGSRAVTLNVPEAGDLVVGQALLVKVSAKP